MPALERVDLDLLGVENIRSVLCGDVRVRERMHADVKWRASGDPEKKDVRLLTMYPAVFNQVYTLYEGKSFVIQEQVDPGFFDDVLEDDCHLNYGHQSVSAMCRNNPHLPLEKRDGPGSMDLSVDGVGLRVYAQIPMNDLDAQRLAPKMDNGVVDQSSYAFTVAEEDFLSTTDDQGRSLYLYTLKKCARLYDVCVCPLGANEGTQAALRSLAGQLAGRSSEGIANVPGRSPVEGPEAAEGRSTEGSLAKERALLEVESALAVLQFRPRK